MYNPAIGRWNGVDRKSEFYSDWSPFHFALNNPVRFIDPNGESVQSGGQDTASFDLAPVVITAERTKKSSSWSTAIHLTLDGVGFIPGLGEIADIANASLYAVEGDWENAAYSIIGLVPFVGDGIKVAGRAKKLAEAAAKVEKHIGKVEGVYEIAFKNGKKYIGESQDVVKRLKQHGKKTGGGWQDEVASIKVTEVGGGKAARRFAEQTKMNDPYGDFNVGGAYKQGKGHSLNKRNAMSKDNYQGFSETAIETGVWDFIFN